MRLRDIAAILAAVALTGALIWYVASTFLVNLTVLAVVVTLFLFAGLGHWIVSDSGRRQAITRHKGLFMLTGLFVMLLAAVAAMAVGRFNDLMRNGFGFVTVVFLAGVEIALLPRGCWWADHFQARHTRR